MVKPNFFIVGAPKSGTTAMYSYLKQHPQVYLPKKEIFYFCYDLAFRTPKFNESVYLSYYSGAGQQNAIGDASVLYLLSPGAAQAIKAFNPEARIIIMLRNPVQMVYSFYNQLFSNGDEPIENFEQALNAESSRKSGALIPNYYRCPIESFYYSEVAKYYEQVLRYKSVFEEDKILIIFYDDFKANIKQEYFKVLNFLKLKELVPESFEVINAHKGIRSKTYLKFLMNPPGFIKSIGRALFPHHTERRQQVIDWLWSFNAKHIASTELNNELKKRLIDMYREDIKKLGKLLNRDLSDWLKV